MRTPAELLAEVAKIFGAEAHNGRLSLDFRWEDGQQAKAVLDQIADMLRKLRLLRSELSQSTNELRQLYSQKLAHIDQLASKEDQTSLLYDRRISAQVDADMRRTVRVERSDALSPYLAVGRTLAAVELRLRTIQNQVRTSPEYLTRPASAKPRSADHGHQYFVRIGSARKGPISAEQVRGLVKLGVIALDDQVQVEGIDMWTKISSIEELGNA